MADEEQQQTVEKKRVSGRPKDMWLDETLQEDRASWGEGQIREMDGD